MCLKNLLCTESH
uniref:Uncharacterized protein n=1 Tax=Rhizophora mucronata TaxID=61149 RepID=A0A2P2PZ34_RHIMU